MVVDMKIMLAAAHRTCRKEKGRGLLRRRGVGGIVWVVWGRWVISPGYWFYTWVLNLRIVVCALWSKARSAFSIQFL